VFVNLCTINTYISCQISTGVTIDYYKSGKDLNALKNKKKFIKNAKKWKIKVKFFNSVMYEMKFVLGKQRFGKLE